MYVYLATARLILG